MARCAVAVFIELYLKVTQIWYVYCAAHIIFGLYYNPSTGKLPSSSGQLAAAVDCRAWCCGQAARCHIRCQSMFHLHPPFTSLPPPPSLRFGKSGTLGWHVAEYTPPPVLAQVNITFQIGPPQPIFNPLPTTTAPRRCVPSHTPRPASFPIIPFCFFPHFLSCAVCLAPHRALSQLLPFEVSSFLSLPFRSLTCFSGIFKTILFEIYLPLPHSFFWAALTYYVLIPPR